MPTSIPDGTSRSLSPMTALEALTALHFGEGAAVALARLAPNGWQECGAILATDLAAKWSGIETHLASDSYFTISSTYLQPRRETSISAIGLPLWSRKAERLRWLNAVAVDLDHHAAHDFSVEPLLDAFHTELAEQQIPSPTFLSFSGRGLWALWQLTDHVNQGQPVRAFPDKRDLLSRINKALVAKFKNLGADRQATDPARVMRLPDSLNSKAAPDNARVRFFRISASVYTLPELASALGVHACKVSLPGEQKRKDAVRANAAVMRWRRPLEGFRALWTMRGRFMLGTRRPAIYVYAMLLRKNRATAKEILTECSRLAESVQPIVSEADVKHQIASSEKATRYNFSNAKLAEMLKITAEEKAALPQWFRPKTESKTSRIAERRDIIFRELQAATEPISTRRLVALLQEKHGLRVSQFTVQGDLRSVGERFSVLIGSEASLDKQKKSFTPKNTTKSTSLSYKQKKPITQGAQSEKNSPSLISKTNNSKRLNTKLWIQLGGTT